jgi:hypothetical protein
MTTVLLKGGNGNREVCMGEHNGKRLRDKVAINKPQKMAWDTALLWAFRRDNTTPTLILDF